MVTQFNNCILVGIFVKTQADIKCHICYKKPCRDSFYSSELTRNESISECRENVTFCLKYYLRSEGMAALIIASNYMLLYSGEII